MHTNKGIGRGRGGRGPRRTSRSWAWPEAMGGGVSKQAQLERYGQLLSPAERQALENTFHEIAGSQQALSFTEKQLTVRSTCPYFVH